MAFIINNLKKEMRELKRSLEKFLQHHHKPSYPLLVGFSGGPDSLALVELLLEFKEKYSIEIELAHIDHNYREESSLEAQGLKEWALKQKLVFHLLKIDKVPSKNIEDTFRQKRYEFFLDLFKKNKYQALLLAHHRNDLEETTLKRMLEGAFISNLCAIEPITDYKGMIVWRPLLESSKDEILEYIEVKGLSPIIDPTNFDGSNLRSKMRTNIIPNIEKELGKNIRSSLYNLAQYSEMVSNYLKENLKGKVQSSITPRGICLDFSLHSLHPLEMYYFLKQTLKDYDVLLNRSELSTAIELIQTKKIGKEIVKKNARLFFDHQKLFIKTNC